MTDNPYRFPYVPVGGIIEWDGTGLIGAPDLSTPEKVAAVYGYGTWERRVGSGADGGADAVAQSLSTNRQQWRNRKYKIRTVCGIKNDGDLDAEYFEYGDFKQWRRKTHAHRQQVHGLLYVEANRLTQKGVAV